MNNREYMQMKNIQCVSLDILKFVSNICEKEGFRYCLAYGTLIGAVRHKGYIPWDDDVDILMPRADYDKFLHWTRTHKEDMGVYEVFNREINKDYIYGITRICDSRYEIIKDNEPNCGMGIFIDVYPYDGLGDDRQVALEKLHKARKYCDAIVAMTRNNQRVPTELNLKGRLMFLLTHLIRKVHGLNYYFKQLNSLKDGYDFDTSKYVGPLMWYFTKPYKVLFERALFNEFVKVSFEDGMFYVPSEYDKILTQEYGDYMTLPPVEKRIYQHEYKAYKK